jgi:uncharacterized repeat protein (TIGR03803 family)
MRIGWWKTACAVCVLCAAAAIALPAQTLTTLHSFDGTDGANPFAGLVQATNGNLYGATSLGGANNLGAIFKITPDGALTMLYSFCSQSGCTDGAQPYATLVQAINGNFYGTTEFGGANNDGSVFSITPSDVLTTLYSFCSQSGCTDGLGPTEALLQAANQNLYGTTVLGGANNGGTVFEITANGTLKTLYNFCSQSGCTDGLGPAALIQATNGNFYGTTANGGALGYGTVFEVTPSGTLTTLYSFCSQTGCADGKYPAAALVQATDGDFYGTTNQGGANRGKPYGTVFKVTASGALTTLHSFDSTDGASPSAPLIQATDGNFYGTTYFGGANPNGYGTVFKITPSGAVTTLHSFQSREGSNSYAGLIQATNGNFYGTTRFGGANNACSGGCGTVFSLSVGLGPFVETLPTSTKVGAGIRILGTNLTGATSVTFNGTPAVFEVVSSSFITTTVPAGATSGNVQVVTPGGTLTSNVPFRVLP